MTKTISIKFPAKDLSKIPDKNISRFFREAVYEKIDRVKKTDCRPKTAFGKKLLKIRADYIKSGGKLLSAEEINREVRERSGARD